MKRLSAAFIALTLLAPSAYCAPVWEGDVCRVTESLPSSRQSAKDNPVAFIGDSLAYGLAQASGALNGGVVGIGLAGKRLRSMTPLNQTTLSSDYQRWTALSRKAQVIVEIGTNDFGYTKPAQNYALLLDRYILPLRPACLVLPPPTMRKDVMQGVETLWPVMQAWGADHAIRVIPFPQFSASERAADGIHFTHTSYARLARDVRRQCGL